MIEQKYEYIFKFLFSLIVSDCVSYENIEIQNILFIINCNFNSRKIFTNIFVL